MRQAGGRETRMVYKAARLTAATALGALVLAGCASSPTAAAPAPAPTPALARTAEPPPPVPPAPSAPDLRQFVIAPTDIPLPGFGAPTFGPLGESAVEGLTAYFESEDGERQLGETIVLLPDADAARSALQGAATQTEQQRPGAQSTPVPVGDGGRLISGYQREGTASTLLLFTAGRASVAMDFRSAATDPVPAETAVAAGERQAALLASYFG